MSKKKTILSIFVIILIVPLMILLESLVYQAVRFDTKYAQIIMDTLVIIFATIFNQKVLKLKVDWFSTKHPFRQLLNLVPLMILMLFFNKFSNLGVVKNMALTVIAIILVATAEEYVYRGLLMAQIQRVVKNPFLILLISSVGFGLIHITNMFNASNKWLTVAQMIIAAASGMLYAALYYKTHNLTLAILMHLIYDLPAFFHHGMATAENIMTPDRVGEFLLISAVFFLICSVIALLQVKQFHFSRHIQKLNSK
jgi:membrane protease YdiL (CAAX protease family)